MVYRPDLFVQPIKPPDNVRTVEHFVPTLFLGLGGTGKSTLMHLRKRFHEKYGETRRDVVRYLILDTDMKKWWPGEKNRKEDFLPVKPREDEQIDCQISNSQFDQVFEMLEKQDDPRYVGWLKKEIKDYGYRAVIDGCGQHRQFGRVAFLLNYVNIRTRIANHLESLLRHADHVSSVPGNEVSIERNTVEVVLVTSLAGGTGSGMMIDMAYLVKDIVDGNDYLRQLKKGIYTTMICVLPSAFRGEDDSAYTRLQQNSYASLLELEYYGSAKSGDELFIGQIKDERARRSNIGFNAPWKPHPRQFIDGHGWQACYIVDNATPLTLQKRLSADDTYQMLADYLFLDFERTEFAVQKRSQRCNLAQYQQGYIQNRVRRPEAALKGDRGVMYEGTDVLFATQNSCSFNSLGIGEIAFDTEGIYRAAAYRLAYKLIQRNWLGAADRFQATEYEALARRDLLQPEAAANAISFDATALTKSLYRKGGGNFLALAEDDLVKVRSKPFQQGSSELQKLESAHAARLARSPKGIGPAAQNVEEQRGILAGNPRELGPLRRRLLELLAQRYNQFGVAVTREFVEWYRRLLAEEIEKCGKAAARGDDATGNALARLREADTVPIPGRRTAQRIEFPRACEQLRQVVVGSYHRQAAESVRLLLLNAQQYLGKKDEEIPPALDEHRTLWEHSDRAQRRLEALRDRLNDRFVQSKLGHGTDRTQSLLPTEWDENRYDDKLRRALTMEFQAPGDPTTDASVDWGKLSDRVFETLKTDQPSEYGEVLSLAHLLDKWAKSHVTSAEAIGAVAETLFLACRKILLKAGLNFEDQQRGSVVDLLMVMPDPAVREKRLENLVKTAAPYLPLDAQAQQSLTGHYQMKFQTLLGTREGQLGERSRLNRDQVIGLIADISATLLPEQGRVERSLDSSPSSLILCREVWGVPLQFYSLLNTLYSAYSGSNIKDELHINCHQKMADLPDIRVISPDAYERIRDNIEHVLLALVRGVVTWRNDAYGVHLWDAAGHGSDFVVVGSRISGIVKVCCDDEGIRRFLVEDRKVWESRAKPRDWAILYASVAKTYEFARREIQEPTDRHISPLRNCFRILLEDLRSRLNETEEGRRWFEYLRPREDGRDSPEDVQRYQEAIARIERDRLLFRPSEFVPIFEVNWKAVTTWNLPPETTPAN